MLVSFSTAKYSTSDSKNNINPPTGKLATCRIYTHAFGTGKRHVTCCILQGIFKNTS